MAEGNLTKRCYVCKEEKPVEDFYPNKSKYDGLSSMCKQCNHEQNVKKSKDGVFVRQYRKQVSTPEGIAEAAWGRINSRIRNHAAYVGIENRMTKEEFLNWAVPAYREWMDTHDPSEKPSVDRKEGTGHYEISNLQIIHYRKNCGKTSRAINVHLPEGHKQCGRCKEVLAFDKFKPVKPGATGTFGLYGWCIECSRAYERDRTLRKKQRKLELNNR